MIQLKDGAKLAERELLRVLDGHRLAKPPIWMMRQAGRYLPEYRQVREQAGSFLNLCYNPELACEVTLQPIRRFGFDAAILFSDILVVPDALGQGVRFETGEGPRLDPIENRDGLKRLSNQINHGHLEPVYQAIRLIRQRLPDEVTLLGFCGAPWTVATYMVAGRGTPDQEPARMFAYRDRDGFQLLIDRLVEASSEYLIQQMQAGVDAVQIFDTWAGILSDEEFARWVIAPTKRIIENLRREVPGARVIGFPRGAGARLVDYVAQTGIDAVGIDWAADRQFVAQEIQPKVAVQGNVDPMALLAGGAALDEAVDATMAAFSNGRFIFNLGHGITPMTPIGHVEQMLHRVRNWKPE